MSVASSYPSEVAPLLEELLARIQLALGDNFLGAYLGGSIALGAFDSEKSDVDILAVTERPLQKSEIELLAAVHAEVPPRNNRSSQLYEVYYIDRETIRRFRSGQRHVKVAFDGLIDSVSPEEIQGAAAEELRARHDRWRNGHWPQKDMSLIGTQAFEVQTVCRALQTVRTGRVSSKREAVEWALQTLPARWRSLIGWSVEHQAEWTVNPRRAGEALEFLGWAVEELR
jgi:predicted nucleotidyltransferase